MFRYSIKQIQNPRMKTMNCFNLTPQSSQAPINVQRDHHIFDFYQTDEKLCAVAKSPIWWFKILRQFSFKLSASISSKKFLESSRKPKTDCCFRERLSHFNSIESLSSHLSST